VTGDETRTSHCPGRPGWEGAGSREIRESEDLPTSMLMIPFEAKGEGRGAKKLGAALRDYSLRAFLLIKEKGGDEDYRYFRYALPSMGRIGTPPPMRPMPSAGGPVERGCYGIAGPPIIKGKGGC
jgi:hypothetical protein